MQLTEFHVDEGLKPTETMPEGESRKSADVNKKNRRAEGKEEIDPVKRLFQQQQRLGRQEGET